MNLISGQGFAPYLSLLLRSDKVRHTSTYRSILFMRRILPLSNKSCTCGVNTDDKVHPSLLDPDYLHAYQFKKKLNRHKIVLKPTQMISPRFFFIILKDWDIAKMRLRALFRIQIRMDTH
jgi:hypothetical protein